MYKLLRALLFLFDPEKVHYFSMNLLRLICRIRLFRTFIGKTYSPANSHPTTLFNLTFKNKVGLAAGFDKNASYLNELEALGFGFVEIGTVTPKPQEGNEKPRLFRLPKDRALINRMGFNNEGVDVIAKRLLDWRKGIAKRETKNGKRDTVNPASRLIIGGNIGKNKTTPNEDAWKDYEICFEKLHDFVDYFVVNVSSPNTPGLRELQEKESLRKIFSVLQTKNILKKNPKPLLLKIAPDLEREQVDDVIALALEINLNGLIVSNTTIQKEGLRTKAALVKKIGAGGMSGSPLRERSTALISYIHSQSKGRIPIIGSGGIFNGAEAKEKLNAGASLVQVWTGFVYEGPSIVNKISGYLADSEM
jgi:dihydroorotate dehydrogenase